MDEPFSRKMHNHVVKRKTNDDVHNETYFTLFKNLSLSIKAIQNAPSIGSNIINGKILYCRILLESINQVIQAAKNTINKKHIKLAPGLQKLS
jgi:hypothetical protein